MYHSIRIAICGGGLAGAYLLHALLPHKHLDIHIFESAAEFKEVGMAIGIARNALAALDLIGPSAAQCLERAGAVPLRGIRFMLAQGEDSCKMIDEANDDVSGQRVAKRMHASSKLEKTERNSDESIKLHFTNGTAHECDILIGADGIHSQVRKFILGEDDPAAFPRNTGSWCVMALKPYAEAQASIGNGPVDIEDAREYSWIGDNAYLMHNVLNRGELVQVAIASHEKDAESSDRWHRVVSADEIKKLYQNWPSHLYKAVYELFCDQPEQPAMYLWEHPPARTYVSGPVCMMGDAAHATSPWQGSGGGMSIEDSLILSALLGRAKTSAEAVIALKVYDQVRRPRTQRIVESSRGTGEIMIGSGEETKLDFEKLREKLLLRWEFIINIDNKKHCDEAVEMMEKELLRV